MAARDYANDQVVSRSQAQQAVGVGAGVDM